MKFSLRHSSKGWFPPSVHNRSDSAIYFVTSPENPHTDWRRRHGIRAACKLEESGLSEFIFSRAAFVPASQELCKVAFAFHMDNGVLTGNPRTEEFKNVYAKISQRFNIKEWQAIDEKGVDFLGCRVFRQGSSTITGFDGVEVTL